MVVHKAYSSQYHPIHPSVRDRLDKDYVDHYNRYLINQPLVQHLPLAVSRQGGQTPPAHSTPLAVGTTQDFRISRRETFGPKIEVRCFTPHGAAPKTGWPLVLYYHGGGWVFGDISSENTICTNLCIRAQAVVITTGYRLAPECPWPAAIHDGWEAFLWATSKGAELLNINTRKIAFSGASAGSNIAAVMAQRAVAHPQPGISICAQLLVVPITDNTATPLTNPTWQRYEFTAGLPAEKMLWYRHHYLPNKADWSHPEASPLFASDEIFARLPPTLVIVAELDVLRGDGEEYAKKLRANRVCADVMVMEGMPHPFVAMDAKLDAAKRAITIMCERLLKTFA